MKKHIPIVWLAVTAAAVIVCGPVGCSGSDPIPSAAAPTFSPAAGTNTAPQVVTLGCETAGAIIYYTLDGSVPTTSSTVYSGPITVSSTTTIKAVAVASGFTESGIASGVYTITPPGQVATPTFSPPPDTYPSQQSVTISCATPNAIIYYTTDGSAPGPGSHVYAGPIDVPRTVMIRAVAVADGYASSSSATGFFRIDANPGPVPTFSPPPGTYSAPQSVTLSYPTPGAWILYWIVEDNPGWATTYTGPINVSRTMTIAAYVYPLGNDAAIGAYVITSGSGP